MCHVEIAPVKLFIPWRLFFNAFSKQPSNERQAWLELFKFSDGGAELIKVVVFIESEKPSQSGLTEFERTMLSAIAEPKPQRFLH